MTCPERAPVTVLGIDTAGILGGVALARGGRLLAEVRCDARAAASERILPQITRLLDDLGIEKGEIGRIGVSLGPGSFTGQRVGLATAKGLSLGLDIPVVGVSSLQARIFALRAVGPAVLATISPRRGQVFAAAGFWSEVGYQALLPEASRLLREAGLWVDEVLEAARRVGRRPLICTGDAAELVLEELRAAGRAEDQAQFLVVPGMPGALPGAVALIAAEAPEDKALAGAALDELVPRYLRSLDARPPGSGKGGHKEAAGRARGASVDPKGNRPRKGEGR